MGSSSRLSQVHRRSNVAVGLVISMLVSMVALAAPSSGAERPTPAAPAGSEVAFQAQTGTAIQFLNPSGHSRVVSSEDDGTYHLVAWVNVVPANPTVEFNYRDVVGVERSIGTANRVGTSNVFELLWNLDQAQVSDAASATLEAVLFSGSQSVASDEEVVEINDDPSTAQVPADEAVEILYPRNNAQLGVNYPLRGAPVTIVDVVASGGSNVAPEPTEPVDPPTSYVKVLYTLNQPGTEPTWKECGIAAVDSTDGTLPERVRCEFESAADATNATALAAVANATPADPNTGESLPYEPTFDGAGDAHRVTTYRQAATQVIVDPATQRVNPDESNAFGCSPPMFARVLDQLGRLMGGVNVDVHAFGPSDNLWFDTADYPGTTRDAKAPETGGHTLETAYDCEVADFDNEQGEHDKPGPGDIKHIESVAGTNNEGQFGFALISGTAGTTYVEVFPDIDDDDVRDQNEPIGRAAIGWGQNPAPQPPTIEIVPDSATGERGECVRFTAYVGGNQTTTANIDIHITGPDASVTFCNPGDASISRPPDTGDHTGDTHTDGTRHIEGEAANGQFNFGVTSAAAGTTQILGWIDQTDDDVRNDEPSDEAVLAWTSATDCTLEGTPGDDTLPGTPGEDIICGYGGNDTLTGRGGDDTIRGGGGRDVIRGGGGNDTLKGGAGGDSLYGNRGRDALNGGRGRDLCRGGAGRDTTRRCER